MHTRQNITQTNEKGSFSSSATLNVVCTAQYLVHSRYSTVLYHVQYKDVRTDSDVFFSGHKPPIPNPRIK